MTAKVRHHKRVVIACGRRLGREQYKYQLEIGTIPSAPTFYTLKQLLTTKSSFSLKHV
jgi:hypothetical protein